MKSDSFLQRLLVSVLYGKCSRLLDLEEEHEHERSPASDVDVASGAIFLPLTDPAGVAALLDYCRRCGTARVDYCMRCGIARNDTGNRNRGHGRRYDAADPDNNN